MSTLYGHCEYGSSTQTCPHCMDIVNMEVQRKRVHAVWTLWTWKFNANVSTLYGYCEHGSSTQTCPHCMDIVNMEVQRKRVHIVWTLWTWKSNANVPTLMKVLNLKIINYYEIFIISNHDFKGTQQWFGHVTDKTSNIS